MGDSGSLFRLSFSFRLSGNSLCSGPAGGIGGELAFGLTDSVSVSVDILQSPLHLIKDLRLIRGSQSRAEQEKLKPQQNLVLWEIWGLYPG